MNPVPGGGRGIGFRRGRGGRGWRHGFCATGLSFQARTPVPGATSEVSPDYETQTLKSQAAYMEKSLEEIRRRISELEAGQASKG